MLARRRAVFRILAAFAVITMLPSAAAPAAAPRGTKIVVSLKLPAFHGKLKSGKRSCVANRRVKLLRKRPGPDKVLRRDRSNRKGRWSTRISKGSRIPPGTYYVKAAKRGKCKAATSRRLVIPRS